MGPCCCAECTGGHEDSFCKEKLSKVIGGAKANGVSDNRTSMLLTQSGLYKHGFNSPLWYKPT